MTTFIKKQNIAFTSIFALVMVFGLFATTPIVQADWYDTGDSCVGCTTTSDWSTYDTTSSDWSTYDTSTSNWDTYDTTTSDWSTYDTAVSDWSTYDTTTSDWGTYDTTTSDWTTYDTTTSDWTTYDTTSSDWGTYDTTQTFTATSSFIPTSVVVSRPPTYNPPTYNPPTYNPPTYNPPTYNPPTYPQPPIYYPPVYYPPVQPPAQTPINIVNNNVNNNVNTNTVTTPAPVTTYVPVYTPPVVVPQIPTSPQCAISATASSYKGAKVTLSWATSLGNTTDVYCTGGALGSTRVGAISTKAIYPWSSTTCSVVVRDANTGASKTCQVYIPVQRETITYVQPTYNPSVTAVASVIIPTYTYKSVTLGNVPYTGFDDPLWVFTYLALIVSAGYALYAFYPALRGRKQF